MTPPPGAAGDPPGAGGPDPGDDGGFRPACALRDLKEGIGRGTVVDNRAVALFRRGGEVLALSNRCPHNGQTLHDGELRGNVLTCRWHGWRFDVETGRAAEAPAGEECPRIRLYRARVVDGIVEVSVTPVNADPPPGGAGG